ncbi:MAG TPA: glycerol-3-phosphate 1-O-acyltransferase PlsY [bacterium]|nr:glycerol-3-phosphate 1-O-acyltransferase PlsY [bacterium]HPN33876.1 glycerol-3-phosphate 1-O-acyltransferase PlsY [bacterium]
MLLVLLVLLLAYLLGSLPTALVVGKLMRGIDIRQHGSGNAGGTNVFRVLGWKPGLFVMLMDAFKGFVAAIWLPRLAFSAAVLPQDTLCLFGGLAAIIGHIWTVFAGFRGGKGVGTAAGVLLALYPPLVVLICFVVFLLVLALTRIVSISSISAAVAFPVVLSILKYSGSRPISATLYYFSFFAALLIIYTHRSNIRRLLNGTENKFGKKGKPTQTAG